MSRLFIKRYDLYFFFDFSVFSPPHKHNSMLVEATELCIITSTLIVNRFNTGNYFFLNKRFTLIDSLYCSVYFMLFVFLNILLNKYPSIYSTYIISRNVTGPVLLGPSWNHETITTIRPDCYNLGAAKFPIKTGATF